jgi:nucleoside-diphosphate-sugar epimerase
LFVSSDVVYGNNTYVNDELSTLNPFGNYAKLKYLIENEFLYSKYFKSLRLSFVFSKFDSFFLYLKKSLLENNVANVFSGLRRNIIYIDDVILSIYQIILGIIKDDFMIKDLKTLNLVGQDNLSRSDMALIFNQRFSSLKVNIIKTPPNYLTNRPDSIYTKSLFLDKIIKKELVTYSHFINNLGEKL